MGNSPLEAARMIDTRAAAGADGAPSRPRSWLGAADAEAAEEETTRAARLKYGRWLPWNRLNVDLTWNALSVEFHVKA